MNKQQTLAKLAMVFLQKQLSACMFGVFLLCLVFFSQQFYTPAVADTLHFYRYDFMLLCALAFQVFLLATKLETAQEFLVIIIFHIMAFVMEVFKVYVGSWVYPEPALLAIAGVPLFAGFMYSAVGSYIARVHKNFQITYRHYPKNWLTVLLVLSIYINFFSHHFWRDLRWVLVAASVLLFYRTTLYFQIQDFEMQGRVGQLPVLLLFVVIAVLIWIAENIATYSNVWLYPNQIKQWRMVSVSKISSWYLLMLLSFVLVMLLHRPNKQPSKFL